MCRCIYLNDQYKLRIHSTPAVDFSLIPYWNHTITQLLFQNWEKILKQTTATTCMNPS